MALRFGSAPKVTNEPYMPYQQGALNNTMPSTIEGTHNIKCKKYLIVREYAACNENFNPPKHISQLIAGQATDLQTNRELIKWHLKDPSSQSR